VHTGGRGVGCSQEGGVQVAHTMKGGQGAYRREGCRVHTGGMGANRRKGWRTFSRGAMHGE
jgi:hypothetical protein